MKTFKHFLLEVNNMKALSIKQPWAWLIVNGYKDVENRMWATQMKGRIYVHAGKSFDESGYNRVKFNFPQIKMPTPEEFEYGGIVGTVEIVECVTNHKSPWFEGTFGYVLKNPQKLKFIPCIGKLKFFEPKF